jgi:hypothetical protein
MVPGNCSVDWGLWRLGRGLPRWYGDALDLDHITTSLMQQWECEHPEPNPDPIDDVWGMIWQ